MRFCNKLAEHPVRRCNAYGSPDMKDHIPMRHMSLALVTVALLATTAVPALAQAPSSINPVTGARPGHEVGVGDSLPLSNKASNIVPADTKSAIAPTLPPPSVGDNAAAHDYLRAARASLAAGRTGQAQQSLEMAETRALDRSVPQGQTNTPSSSEFIARIQDARHALGGGNSAHAIRLIDLALAS
jgi:hypothetical protein